ncbi:MAG TPA: cation transporter [Actinotalea sp.]|jgi:copper chaperone CopZ
MSTQTVTINVAGMTCGHCVRSVQEEVGAIAGVTDVAVELVAGGESQVRISSTEPLTDDDIRGAIVEAGYTLVGTSVVG